MLKVGSGKAEVRNQRSLLHHNSTISQTHKFSNVITYISILRGINVGNKQIKMADLQKLYEDLGFENITTYIQSGNVIFSVKESIGDSKVAEQIEKKIADQYPFEVPVIVRTVEEWQAGIDANPFLKRQDVEPDKLHVTFLAEAPGRESLEKIAGYDYPPDEFEIVGKEVYLRCPNGYGRTKLSNTFFESKLKVTATTRNWKTVKKLLELVMEK